MNIEIAIRQMNLNIYKACSYAKDQIKAIREHDNTNDLFNDHSVIGIKERMVND